MTSMFAEHVSNLFFKYWYDEYLHPSPKEATPPQKKPHQKTLNKTKSVIELQMLFWLQHVGMDIGVLHPLDKNDVLLL